MILDSTSPSLRFKKSCAETGFHAALFQFAAFTYYPVHHRTLRDTSGFDQNQPPKSRFHTPFRWPYQADHPRLDYADP